MGYTELENRTKRRKAGRAEKYAKYSLEREALDFIRESCEGLRFDPEKAAQETEGKFLGASLREGQIPYNMQMDIDRLCLENAVGRFLRSGRKEDAFDVYFCYLEMFVGDYEKTRRMIELLSEFKANGSGLLMKHRDHYSHSVYVFLLGLAIYQSNKVYRKEYCSYYGLEDDHKAACHYLQYWGLTSLFHDIGYPFELPFEQVVSYFEVEGDDRTKRPFIAYRALDKFVELGGNTKQAVQNLYGGLGFTTTDEVFAHVLTKKLGEVYSFTEDQMLGYLREKPILPENFSYFMDHAYFSATVLFQKLFGELGCELRAENIDALTAILMHNSLYKFSIARYKKVGNIPFKANLHPLAYMLMLCDELQCWDRTAYGRNSKKELHPMGCSFELVDDEIRATYLYDIKEIAKINQFKDAYIEWLQGGMVGKAPGLKAYAGMFIKNSAGISDFQADIEKIVDLKEIKLCVGTGIMENLHTGSRSYLSDSNFINLYYFAMILNGRWNNAAWKRAKEMGQQEKFLSNEKVIGEFTDSFKKLSLEYKLYNIGQAKAFARYMDQIDCFYTDRAVDFELLEHFSEKELVTIGVLEHRRWLQEHYDMGWEYGEPEKSERELVRRHKDMIPGYDPQQEEVTAEQAGENYRRLDQEEQDKDTDPMECMLTMLRMFDGIRIYRL